jgi:hypothetical protein
LVFREFSNAGFIKRKLLPGLEYDLQHFPNEEISKSEILDMVCAMKSFKNINEMFKNNHRVMHVKWAYST